MTTPQTASSTPLNAVKLGFFLIYTLVVTLLLSGCSTLNDVIDATDIRTPEISIKESTVSKLSLDGAELLLKVNVNNPNPVPIKLTNMDYTLELADRPFIQGVLENGIDIPAKRTSTTTVPITVKFSDLEAILQNIKNRDTLDFKLTTHSQIALPIIGERTIPAELSGSFPIPRLPKITLHSIAVEKLSFTGAQLNLKLNLENPNAFNVVFNKLAYTFKVNNTAWIESNIKAPINVEKNKTAELEIPIKLNFLTLGNTAYQTLTSRSPLDYQISGDMDLGSSLQMLQQISKSFQYDGTFNL